MPSTRSVGLAFEKLSIAVLRRNLFDIEHCGKSGDKGIDFKGHWVLVDREIPVIGQCKCHSTRLPPMHVRELEGTLTQMRSYGIDFIGMLITATGFSPGAITACQRSPLPLVLCQVQIKHHSTVFDSKEKEHSLSGYISKFLYNQTLKTIVPTIRISKYHKQLKQEIIITTVD